MRVFLLLLIMMPTIVAADGGWFIVGAINGGAYEKHEAYFLKEGDHLSLNAVRWDGAHYRAGIPPFVDDKDVHETLPWDSPSSAPDWYEIQPVLKEYKNGNFQAPGPPRSPVELIEYRWNSISMTSDLNSTHWKMNVGRMGLGTHYFGIYRPVEIDGNGSYFSTELLSRKWSHRVIQVVCRKDDSYFGFLWELFGTPFILGPIFTNSGMHQTDYRIGSDCAAFATYGMRRQGYELGYLGPRGILRYLTPIYSGTCFPVGGVYCDLDSKPISLSETGLEPGDIVHFGQQVSVFAADGGVAGVLDLNDSLLQSYGDTPHHTTFARSGFVDLPVRLFKWRSDLPHRRKGGLSVGSPPAKENHFRYYQGR